jgi:hypothetical protein
MPSAIPRGPTKANGGHQDQHARRADDAAPPRRLVPQNVRDEGQGQPERDQHRGTCGKVLEVLQPAAEHADAERQRW